MLESFDGYADASVLWADLKVDSKHAGALSRVAIIADQTWLKWGALAATQSIGHGIFAADLAIVSDDPKTPEHYKALFPKGLSIVHSTVEVHKCRDH